MTEQSTRPIEGDPVPAEGATTALVAIPTGNALTAMFAKPENVDSILSAIEQAARAEVVGLSVDTKKGRDAIKSAAFKVARSKTALDDAGKGLTEDWRKQTATVNAERNRIAEYLDKVKADIRKPVEDWEAAEEKRVADLKARLDAIDQVATSPRGPSAQVREQIAQIEAIAIDDSWAEYLPLAAKAKDVCLAALRRDLAVIEQREADAAELERLRAEKAKRDEEDRIQREAEELAQRQKDRADSLIDHIEECGQGMIGGEAQPWAILIYELERKVPAEIDDRLGDHRERVQATLDATLTDVRAAFEQAQREAEEKRKAEAEEAAAKAAADAKEKAEREAAEKAEADRQAGEEREAQLKREKDEAAQKERDRIAAEQKAEEDAAAKRAADTAHRAHIRGEIAKALAKLNTRSWEDVADALLDGKIPHTEVKL